jgi:regulator of protease activity HflC (stomatin/prohibitin superfamily)
MIQEKLRHAPHGLLALLGLVLLLAGCVAGFWAGLQERSALIILGSVFAAMATIVCLAGFFIVNPNEARVLQFFGSYVGTVKDPGLRWASPFYSKRTVSRSA